MTNAERLTKLLLKSGAATQKEIDSGQWSEGKCPYVIRTTPTGGRQIQVDKGDVLFRATGKTLGEALDVLEEKVGG